MRRWKIGGRHLLGAVKQTDKVSGAGKLGCNALSNRSLLNTLRDHSFNSSPDQIQPVEVGDGNLIAALGGRSLQWGPTKLLVQRKVTAPKLNAVSFWLGPEPVTAKLVTADRAILLCASPVKTDFVQSRHLMARKIQI